MNGESHAARCWSAQELGSAATRSAGGYEEPDGTAGSPMKTGPRESFPAQRARASEFSCDGRHHLNRCVRTSDKTSRCGCEGAGLPVFDRSFEPHFWFLGASRRCAFAWQSLTRLTRVEILLASDHPSDKQSTVSITKAMITTPTRQHGRHSRPRRRARRRATATRA